MASDDVSAAVEKTASVDSSRIAIVEARTEGRTIGEGVSDFSGRRGRITVDYESRENHNERLPGGEVLFVGTTMYLSRSIFGAWQGTETEEKLKPWLAADLAEQEPSLDSLLFPFPYIDPARLLNALEEVSGAVESLGAKNVRGVETEGYRLTVDLRRAVEEGPAAHRQALLDELERESQKTVPIRVWIDDDGFARRLVVLDGEDELTLDFYDFGVNVDVEAPPDDQVDDFDRLFEGDETVVTTDIDEGQAEEDE